MEMLIESIFMELRSRLRSCNVYITTAVDISKNCNLKISIQANCIVINYYSNYCNELKRRNSLSSIESLSDCYSTEDENEVTFTIPIEEFCNLIPNSMSCLKIEKKSISFRILTEPQGNGNFYKELLSANIAAAPKNETDDFMVNVTTNSQVKIMCLNCSNEITQVSIVFHRVLELPSAILDMSEWFCHGHGHAHGSHTQSEPDTILKPNKSDFLYRLTYFVINNSLLSEKTNKFNSKRNVYHCNRCLAWLGLKDKDTVKLFNSEVNLNQDGTDVQAISHRKSINDLKTDDFIYTIECLIKEFNLGLQYMIMCKIVLECTISATSKQYLMIWIMDKELQVLRNKDNLIKSDKIELSSNAVTKILFKVEMSLNEEVQNWLADPTVVSTDISKSMFTSGLEHLQKMSQKVPEAFRTTNGYLVSYLNA